MKKILIDTDLGSDCDDAGALALAHRLADLGEAEIMAVTHCASEISGAVSVQAINEYYKRLEIPVGRYTKTVFLEESICKKFTVPVMKKYLDTHEMPVFEEAVRIMRRVLAENRDVTLISIGMLNNYADLLRSEPDDISELNGQELVSQSAKELYVMGGNFADFTDAEYNIKTDVKNAVYVAEQFPVPIVYAGFELGVSVKTGENLQHAEPDHPVRMCYDIRQNGIPRESWDPITVYCAIRSENPFFKKSNMQNITFDDNGCAVAGGEGKDCWLIQCVSAEEIQQELEKYVI